jgi:choline dehydrogenase
MRLHADTVIVGAGSSGSVIASRMTENPTLDVMLLEAGPDYPDDAGLPDDLRDGTRNSMRAHDWGLVHRPNARQPRLRFPRGRVVGGSSAVNTCIALRGHPYDYDEWASLGLPEWSFEACLPAFKRLEDDLDFANEWHGSAGPIPVRRHPESECGPWQRAFLDACDALGLERCSDTNDPTKRGYGPHAMNKVGGVRMSAARGYLTPAVRARENLRIVPHTLVHRVRFRDRRVVGLTVETHGRVHDIDAGRVILAAGAIASPGILLRSGVGPRASVERLGVDLVAEVPAVGARLLDHPGVALFFRPRPGQANDTFPLIQNVLRFTTTGSPYRDDAQVQPGSFVPTPWGFTIPLVTLACCVGKPRGHGRIVFRDANPHRRPWIEPRFLDDAADRAAAMEGLRLALRLADTKPMAERASLLWPRRDVVVDDDRFADAIRKVCDSGYHPCGTVPMGPDGDASRRGAVDGRGRVREVRGLWVADASVMPTVPSSNTNVPTLMMGERFGAWFRDGALE